MIDLGQIQAAADRNAIKHSNLSKLDTVSDSPSIIYQLVCDGAGIALMPEWCTTKNTKLIEVPNIDFHYEYYLTGLGNPLTLRTPKKFGPFWNCFMKFVKRIISS